MLWPIVVLLAFSLICSTYAGRNKGEEWDHHEVLDKKENYDLYWTVYEETIAFRFEVATTGWIGFGISKDGRLLSSDVIIGGVYKGEGYLYDYYVDRNGMLSYDEMQNWKLQYFFENRTHTILEVSRALDTCDNHDLLILNGSHPYLFSYSEEDLKSPDLVNDLYPKFRSMWQAYYLTLIQATFTTIPLPKDVSVWDVRAEDFRVPPNVTDFFYCRFIRAPPLRKVHHVIKVAPMITPGYEENIIYNLVNQCVPKSREEAEEAVELGPMDCLSPDMPRLFYRCWNIFSIYLIGSQGIVYPQQAGAPIGGDHPEYYMFLNFYSSPDGSPIGKDMADNSGLRHYYTPNLRPYDSALLWGPGQVISPLIVIPPNHKQFTMSPVTPYQCLSKGMPKEGVKIFATGTCAQLLGRHLKLRHFRGRKELAPITDFPNYNTLHRTFRHLENSVTVLPGDRLVLECTFDSTSRNVTTFGGFPLRNDYCDVLLFHYPPLPYLRILSSPTLQLVGGLTGMNITQRKYRVTIEEGGFTGEATPSYLEYLTHYNWGQDRMCNVEEALQQSPQFAMCADHQENVIKISHVTRPDRIIPYKAPDPCKKYRKYGDLNAEREHCGRY